MWKFLIPPLLLLTACAATPAARQPLDTQHTAGIVGVEVDGSMRAFVFVSKTGKTLPIEAEECAAREQCQGLVKQFSDAQKVMLLRLHGAPIDEEAHYLPHRPLHEIDVQGHIPLLAVRTDSCQIPQFVFDDEGHPLFLLCFRE